MEMRQNREMYEFRNTLLKLHLLTGTNYLRIPDMRQIVHFTLTGIMVWFAYCMLTSLPEMVGPAWSQFLALATEEQWGYMFATTGVVGLIGLVTSNIWVNSVSTFILASAHACIAICFYNSDLGPPNHEILVSVGVYGFIAFQGFALTARRLLVSAGVVREHILLIEILR